MGSSTLTLASPVHLLIVTTETGVGAQEGSWSLTHQSVIQVLLLSYGDGNGGVKVALGWSLGLRFAIRIPANRQASKVWGIQIVCICGGEKFYFAI